MMYWIGKGRYPHQFLRAFDVYKQVLNQSISSLANAVHGYRVVS